MYRSQAEAIIAAERAERYRILYEAEESRIQQIRRAEKAEADNAALTALVKELETVETQWQRDGENSWHNEKYEFRPSGKTKTRKLVNRSDAEALINYERKQATAAHDADAKAFLSAYNRATDLETQLAALRKEFDYAISDEDTGAWRFWNRKARELSKKCNNQKSQNASLLKKIEKRETQLAAARKALEDIASHDMICLKDPYRAILQTMINTAHAVLEAKP